MDEKALVRKYYTAVAYLDRALAARSEVNYAHPSKVLMITTDLLFATELFMKLIIDIESKKLDTISHHNIGKLWGSMSDAARQKISEQLKVPVDFEAINSDAYTTSRYWWSKAKTSKAYTLHPQAVSVLKEYFETIHTDIPEERDVTPVRRFDGKEWHRIN